MTSKRSKAVKIPLLALSMAGMVSFLAACEQKPQEYSSVADCEKEYGVGKCNSAQPQLMTEENRPQFTAKERCEAEFGVGNCESKRNATSGTFFWWPLFFMNRTYYYPPGSGGRGYYGGRPDAVPPRSVLGSRTVATPKPGAVSISPRGGFGGTGSRIGGGGA